MNALASTPPGMPGTHPPIFWLVGTSTGISPQYYYVLSDIADQYWFPSVRSASSRFHSAIRHHQFASVRQADSRLTRLVPPNFELVLTPLSERNLVFFSTGNYFPRIQLKCCRQLSATSTCRRCVSRRWERWRTRPSSRVARAP